MIETRRLTLVNPPRNSPSPALSPKFFALLATLVSSQVPRNPLAAPSKSIYRPTAWGIAAVLTGRC